MTKLDRAISTPSARRIYDTLGSRYDWFAGYEARAKERSAELLKLAPGLRLLEVGVGTGRQLERFGQLLSPGGFACGVDISPVMLRVANKHSHASLCQADALHLPFPSSSFDRLYIAYVLDLLPQPCLPGALSELRRVLKDGGRCVVAALTEGVNLSSRLLIAAWKAFYTLSPIALGGCRPVRLSPLLVKAGFEQVQREVVVQLAMPSEIILATGSVIHPE